MLEILFESLKVDNRKLCNVNYHNNRYNAARKKIYGIDEQINLFDEIVIPDNLDYGLYKCRITYSDIIHKIEFNPYKYRIINSMKMVSCDTIDYSVKYNNRQQITDLLEQRGDCDEIIIVKNGFITDASSSNVAFHCDGKWVTPYHSLLFGTMRAQLIDKKQLQVAKISIDDIAKYDKMAFTNALIGFDQKDIKEWNSDSLILTI